MVGELHYRARRRSDHYDVMESTATYRVGPTMSAAYSAVVIYLLLHHIFIKPLQPHTKHEHYLTMPTAKFVNNNITVLNESDVKLTLLNEEKDPDEPLTLLCPGETRKNFTGKVVSIEPYETYSTRSWRLSEDVDFAANMDVTVTDQSEHAIQMINE